MRGAATSRPITHVGTRPTARPVPPGPITEPEIPALRGPGARLDDRFEVSRAGPAPSEAPTGPHARMGPVHDPLAAIARPLRPVLARGRIGLSVRRAQQRLHRLGLLSSEVLADGIGVFGPKTEEAIRALQQRCGLEVTGRLDDSTDRALRQASRSGSRS